jgi:hypothetical protein
MMWLGKKMPKPIFTIHSFGKIQFMKNRELFFLVKDGNIVICCGVKMHESEW